MERLAWLLLPSTQQSYLDQSCIKKINVQTGSKLNFWEMSMKFTLHIGFREMLNTGTADDSTQFSA
jgi:hypothetical protein